MYVLDAYAIKHIMVKELYHSKKSDKHNQQVLKEFRDGSIQYLLAIDKAQCYSPGLSSTIDLLDALCPEQQGKVLKTEPYPADLSPYI